MLGCDAVVSIWTLRVRGKTAGQRYDDGRKSVRGGRPGRRLVWAEGSMRRQLVALVGAASVGFGVATFSTLLAVPSATAGTIGHGSPAAVSAPAGLRAGIDRVSVGRQTRPDNDGASL